VTATDDPDTADPFAGAVTSTAGGVVSVVPVTISVKAVVRVTPEIRPLIVIVDVPSGVNADVSMVTAVEHVGVQDVAVNVAVVPGGSPVALKGTGFGEPDIKMAATVFDTDDPCATDRLPPFASTKLKDPDSAVTTGLRTPITANSNVRRQIHLRHRAQPNTRERTSPSSDECCECLPAAGRGLERKCDYTPGMPQRHPGLSPWDHQ
jgi:hypothetical protein